MFNKKLKQRVEELEQRAVQLDAKIEKLKNPYIGVLILDRKIIIGDGYYYEAVYNEGDQYKIKKSDIVDKIDNKIKISIEQSCFWFDKDQIVFYGEEKKIKREVNKLVEKYKNKENKKRQKILKRN